VAGHRQPESDPQKKENKKKNYVGSETTPYIN